MNKTNISDLPGVEFRGHINYKNDYVCSGCRKTGVILTLMVPETKYHDGTHLSTKYHKYWMCGDCIAKLTRCLTAAIEEAAQAVNKT